MFRRIAASLHSLFNPPRLRSFDNPEHERKTTWSELFLDLAYVVAVAQLAHGLKESPTPGGAAAFAGLFIPVWWSWIGITFYADRFHSDDVVDRLQLAIQMLAVAALAVQLHDGTGANAPGFALAYAGLRLLLVLQYLRVHWHIPAARPLTRRYVAGFSLAVLPWLASVLVAPPARFLLWAAGLLIDMATPLASRRHQAALPLSPSHLPERFGLLTLIVLGESLVAVVGGVAGQHWAPASVLSAVLAFSFAFAMWWLYFDNVSLAVVRPRRLSAQAWVYTHLLLMMGLAASGAGAERVILTPPGEATGEAARWLFCAAAASCFASLGVLLRTTVRPGVPEPRRDLGPGILLGAAGLMLLAAFLGTRLPSFGVTGSASALAVVLLIAVQYRSRL